MQSEHFLRFILDSDNDIHFTDSLAPLESAPFIWYLLRQEGRARSIVFVRVREDGQPELHVFDSNSRQFLQQLPRSLFSFGRREQTSAQTIGCSSYLLPALKLSEEELMYRLLSDEEAQAALVFTAEAFERLCRRSNDRGTERLKNLMNNPGSSRIFVRLPLDAEALRRIADCDAEGCPVLRDAYRDFRNVTNNKPEAMLDALGAMMGTRLIRLDNHSDEMIHMLRRIGAMEADSADTLQDLTDQAVYLELCRLHRLGLLEPDSEQERYTPVPRRLLYSRLRDPAFHDKLRVETAELREHHPGCSIPNALARQTHLPELPPQPICHDELAQVALSLSIPDDCADKLSWSSKLDKIKRRLITLWNKPRNSEVVAISLELCRSTREAIVRKNWMSLEELLNLLDFFSGQLCAAPERMKIMEDIRTHGRLLVELCDSLHERGSFAAPVGLDSLAARGVEAGDRRIRELLKEYVSKAIRSYGRPDLSVVDLTQLLEEAWTRTQREIENCKELLKEQNAQPKVYHTEPAASEDAFDDFLDSYDYSSIPAAEPAPEPEARISYRDMEVQKINPNTYIAERTQNNRSPYELDILMDDFQ